MRMAPATASGINGLSERVASTGCLREVRGRFRFVVS